MTILAIIAGILLLAGALRFVGLCMECWQPSERVKRQCGSG